MRSHLKLLVIFIFIGLLAVAADARLLKDWAVYYDGDWSVDDFARAIAVSESGNVYVTGRINDLDTMASLPGMEDGLTVAYDAAGRELWTATVAGSPGWDIVADRDDNVYIMCAAGLIKYNASGHKEWESLRWYNWNSPCLTLDDAGYIYVGATTDDGEFITLKYRPDGTVVWEEIYPEGGGRGIHVDDIGNVYVTGANTMAITGADIVTIAYNRWGNMLWARRWEGPGDNNDRPWTMIMDGPNLYVAGNSGDDYVIIAYDSAGTELWARTYDGPDHGHDRLKDITVDPVGNIYVTGTISCSDDNFIATVSYDEYGTRRWIEHYDTTGSGAVGIECDRDRNLIYVAGNAFRSYPDRSFGIAVITYSTAGIEFTTNYYSGPDDSDRFEDMVLDDIGNVFIAGSGSTEFTPYSYDYLTLKLEYLPGPTRPITWPKKPWPVKY